MYDKEHLGKVKYVPESGIDGRYYPYVFVTGYQQPIVSPIPGAQWQLTYPIFRPWSSWSRCLSTSLLSSSAAPTPSTSNTTSPPAWEWSTSRWWLKTRLQSLSQSPNSLPSRRIPNQKSLQTVFWPWFWLILAFLKPNFVQNERKSWNQWEPSVGITFSIDFPYILCNFFLSPCFILLNKTTPMRDESLIPPLISHTILTVFNCGMQLFWDSSRHFCKHFSSMIDLQMLQMFFSENWAAGFFALNGS